MSESVFKIILAIIALGLFSQSINAQNRKSEFDATSAQKLLEGGEKLDDIAARYYNLALADYQSGKVEAAYDRLNMSRYVAFVSPEKFGASIPTDLSVLMIADADLLNEFISSLSEKDNAESVFEIIGKIYTSNPKSFQKYPRLALAIAIVFDTQPPQIWPHHQVSTQVLPRQLPDPVVSFNTWVSQREKGRLLMPLEKLAIEELKYLVSSLSNDEDRQWVQRSVPVNLSSIPKLYPSVPYDYARLKSARYDWEGADYRLKTIREKGGICTDQAYFTAETAKNCGVPAFIFSGAGADGFHAWAAYMKKPGEWNFDVGRYEESRFVTGTTIDPQTWEIASDHDLDEMRESFRRNHKFRRNLMHTAFAEIFLKEESFAKSESAARAAIADDARNFESWRILLISVSNLKRSDDKIIPILNDAIKAFSNYPDLDAFYRKILSNILKKNGKTDEAAKLSTSFIMKTKSNRPDLAMRFARSELEEDIKSGSDDKLFSSYKRLITNFKREGAMAYMGITIPIMNALLNAGKTEQIGKISEITRAVLKPEKNSTLDSNMKNIEAQILKK